MRIRKVCCLMTILNLLVVAGSIAALSRAGVAAEGQDAAKGKTIVAKVNGEPIYEGQLKPQVDKAMANFRKYGAGRNDDALRKRLQAKMLDQMIGNMLVNQEANKRKIENIDEMVDEKIKALEQKFEMERYLKIRHQTMEELRESLKPRARVDDYLKSVGVLDPEIPEERIRAMYDSDPSSFSRDDAVTVSHILVKVGADAGDEEKAKAREKAERIRKEILGGKDFAEAAKEYSDCRSAVKGGDLGIIKKGYMPPEFDQVAFALEKDAVSEPVETKFGYHIIKVTDKQTAGVVPYEDIKAFITKYLQDQESKKKLASHIAELKKKAEIEILLK